MDGKGKEERIKSTVSQGLLGVAALLGVVIVIKLALGMRPVGDSGLLDPYSMANEDPCAAQANPNEKLVDALKKKNMFVPPPPKPKPPGQIEGIFGDQALIGGKWYKKGDSVPPGAKVVVVEATRVKLEWEGREIVLAPIKAAGSVGSSRGGGPSSRGGRPPSAQGGRFSRFRGPRGGPRPEGIDRERMMEMRRARMEEFRARAERGEIDEERRQAMEARGRGRRRGPSRE